MWTTFLASLTIRSRNKSFVVVTAVNILYLLVFIMLYPTQGGQASAIVIFPVAAGAWLLGLRLGLVNALILTIGNFIVFYFGEGSFAEALQFVLGAGSLSVFIVVLLIGGLHDLINRIQTQSKELEKERKALQAEIVERKRAEIELAEINEELNKFAYIVSHDLKAPLRAINNLSDWIEEDMGDNLPGEVQEHLTLMRQRVQRMQDLIDGILQYSRAGRSQSSRVAVNVQTLLDEIVSTLQVPPDFTIKIDDMPTLFTEQIKLEQVFSNLISNAIKYHDRPDGQVMVTCQPNGKFHQFTVSDDGLGIPAEHHERIFGIFQTIAARDTVESTGVGLAIVKKIVEDQHGEIWLESTEGEGTSFHFTWPKNDDAGVQ